MLRTPQVFSSSAGLTQIYDAPPPLLPALRTMMINMDPPVHQRIRGLLKKPDGLLMIQTQDASSVTRRVMGSKWTHFKQLEHVYHFSPRDPMLRPFTTGRTAARNSNTLNTL